MQQAGIRTLVLLLDYRQVPVNGNNILTINLEPGHEALVDSSIVVPATTGNHHLLALVMDYPNDIGAIADYSANTGSSGERVIIKVR